MAQMQKHHQELTNGVGQCSVPMWSMGCPDGFCDKPAYGNRPAGKELRNPHTGERFRLDGKYDGYVPGLACPSHGGPDKPFIDIVFDGPPGPEAGRFVEVENAIQHSIKYGEWLKRPDGYWVLRCPFGEERANG